jgi:hypothetical protein
MIIAEFGGTKFKDAMISPSKPENLGNSFSE